MSGNKSNFFVKRQIFRCTFVLFAIIFFTFTLFFYSCSYTPENGLLTTKNILSVRPGMTVEQVVSILGEPVSRHRGLGYQYRCDCNPQRLCEETSSRRFDYTTKRKALTYPMVWIHFNSRDRVREVYVKKYTLLDDEGIYLVNNNPCDTTDPIIPISSKDIISGEKLKEFFY